MKRILKLFLLTLFTIGTFTQVSLVASAQHDKSSKPTQKTRRGPQGPKGDRGPMGPRGPQGPKGDIEDELKSLSNFSAIDDTEQSSTTYFSEELHTWNGGYLHPKLEKLELLINMVQQSQNRIQTVVLKTILLVKLKKMEMYFRMLQNSEPERFVGLTNQEIDFRHQKKAEMLQRFLNEFIALEKFTQ